MTPTQRILFGAMASLLLMVGLVRAAESFDPVLFGGHADDDLEGSTAFPTA